MDKSSSFQFPGRRSLKESPPFSALQEGPEPSLSQKLEVLVKIDKFSSQVALMKAARDRSSFEPSKLTEIIFGSKEAALNSRGAFERIEKALGSSDMSKLPTCYLNGNQQAQYLEGLRSGSATFEDDLKHGNSHFAYKNHLWALTNANPFGLTRGLCVPFINLQGTKEQAAYWASLAESGAVIFAYSQTELGHGTYVAGIETTATFDVETDEFIIHSPSLSSTKFWPGAIGYTCSHMVVMARLIIGETDHGIHAFIVQVKSLEDYKPLPGIEVGDLGLKMSYNQIDNGYIIFQHVRIPRTNLLMRHSVVSRDGTYTSKPLRQRLLYGGMLTARGHVVKLTAFKFAQALTIATRYSTVRLQGRASNSPSSSETPLIAYKHQQHRLLTQISNAYAILFVSKIITDEHLTLLKDQAAGNYQNLPRLHTLISGLKAWSTQIAADGGEDIRKLCGGHGYMMISGMPEIVSTLLSACTFEGENYILWAQVGKHLLKGLKSDKIPKDMEYMNAFLGIKTGDITCTVSGDDFLSFDTLISIFQRRSSISAIAAHQLVSQALEMGMTQAAAENQHALALLASSRAYIELYVLTSCVSILHQIPTSHPSTPLPLLTTIRNLLTLFALSTIASPFSSSSASFFEHGYLSPTQISTVRSHIDRLVEELVPDAIALTDAWDFTDASLQSAIGCKDGDVYERAMSWVRQLEINVEAKRDGGVMQEGFEKYIRPLLREGMERAKL